MDLGNHRGCPYKEQIPRSFANPCRTMPRLRRAGFRPETGGWRLEGRVVRGEIEPAPGTEERGLQRKRLPRRLVNCPS